MRRSRPRSTPALRCAGSGGVVARNRLTWVLCAVALALVVIPVVWIVGGRLARALPHFHLSLLTTYPIGNVGGLLNSIEGTFVIVFGVLILAGRHRHRRRVSTWPSTPGTAAASILRGASEVLAGVPSIVLGYVG